MSQAQLALQQTKNYDLFKKHPSNRPLVEAIIQRLMTALSEKNDLKTHPLLINTSMQVFDGQHRLEAAKRLELPVFYVIDKHLVDADMVRLNANQSPWKLQDYHNYYVTQGVQDYKDLDVFLKEHSITIGAYMRMAGYARKTNRAAMFKAGKFVMMSEDEKKENLAIWGISRDLIQFVQKRRSDLQPVLKSVNFERGLIQFLAREDVDQKSFRNNLELKVDILGPRCGLGGYYEMFLQIYNFRKRDPIKSEPVAA